jgi:hypothetical protein
MRTAIAAFAILAALLAVPASALTLDEAKASGAVGEQADGYLGVVRDAPDVRALVDDINAKRRAEYQRIAGENGVAVRDIEQLAGKKAVERAAAAGQWVRLPSGEWKQ